MYIREIEKKLEKLELLMDQQPKKTGVILGDAYVGFMNIFASEIGWNKVNLLTKNLVKGGGAANLSEAKEMIPSIGDDPLSAFYVYAYSAFKIAPGWKIKVVEFSQKKIRINCSGSCVLYSAAKRSELEKKIDVYGICYESHSNIIKAVNPNLSYSVLNSICSGNDLCDFVIEF